MPAIICKARFSTPGRVIAVLAAIFLPAFAICQSRTDNLHRLYEYVDQADSLVKRSEQTFYLEKFFKDNYNYRETWRYSVNQGKIMYFQVDYALDSSEFTEVYYVNRGNLVCSEEYEKVNYSNFEDELKSGGIFYFNGYTPEHRVMIGKLNREQSATAPAQLALQRFDKRYSELKRHIPMLPKP